MWAIPLSSTVIAVLASWSSLASGSLRGRAAILLGRLGCGHHFRRFSGAKALDLLDHRGGLRTAREQLGETLRGSERLVEPARVACDHRRRTEQVLVERMKLERRAQHAERLLALPVLVQCDGV